MSTDEAKGFTSRELLRQLVNETKSANERLAKIETHMTYGKIMMDTHEKEIGKLNSFKNFQKGAMAAVSMLGLGTLYHFFKNGL